MNYQSYIKGSDRGDFQWEVLEYDDYGGVIEETCTYRGVGCDVIVRRINRNTFEIEVDNLFHPPFYIMSERASRKKARILAERIIYNDRTDDWKSNQKYV